MPAKPAAYHRYSTGNRRLDQAVRRLVEESATSEDLDLVQEIVITALKLGQDGLDRGDLKMMNSALKELRYALKVFYPYQHIRKVAIFGSARTPRTNADYHLARDFSRLMVKAGWMVITGASTGIMHAGNEGAGRANSFGVNIRLPFEQEANPVIANDSKLINFKYFFTRKLIFVRESDATVLFPGGFGTHDEGFETLTLIQTGKTNPRPVVCLAHRESNYWKAWRHFLKKQLVDRRMIDPLDLGLVHMTHSPEEAVDKITHFYRHYHSMRYIGGRLIFRLKKPLSKKRLVFLNGNFKDILRKGKFLQQEHPFEQEENEPYTLHMPRLAFYFNRRHFGRLIQLIQEINRE